MPVVPFSEGLLYGLATTVLIGPVFFTLLKAALDHGRRGGMLVALGIITSDIVIVCICHAGLAEALFRIVPEGWMALLAGAIIGGLGLIYLFKSATEWTSRSPLRRRAALGLFTTGFIVNFVNPFVFAIWIALVIHATHAHGDERSVIFFLLGALAGILCSDALKALLAPKLRRFLTPRMLRTLYRCIGMAMLLFSARVFVHAYSHLN